MLIVDNSVHSFGFQLDNGIPVVSFYDDDKDCELVHLATYVNGLATHTEMVATNA